MFGLSSKLVDRRDSDSNLTAQFIRLNINYPLLELSSGSSFALGYPAEVKRVHLLRLGVNVHSRIKQLN